MTSQNGYDMVTHEVFKYTHGLDYPVNCNPHFGMGFADVNIKNFRGSNKLRETKKVKTEPVER